METHHIFMAMSRSWGWSTGHGEAYSSSWHGRFHRSVRLPYVLIQDNDGHQRVDRNVLGALDWRVMQ